MLLGRGDDFGRDPVAAGRDERALLQGKGLFPGGGPGLAIGLADVVSKLVSRYKSQYDDFVVAYATVMPA
jgi:hypothetical protein